MTLKQSLVIHHPYLSSWYMLAEWWHSPSIMVTQQLGVKRAHGCTRCNLCFKGLLLTEDLNKAYIHLNRFSGAALIIVFHFLKLIFFLVCSFYPNLTQQFYPVIVKNGFVLRDNDNLWWVKEVFKEPMHILCLRVCMHVHKCEFALTLGPFATTTSVYLI